MKEYSRPLGTDSSGLISSRAERGHL